MFKKAIALVSVFVVSIFLFACSEDVDEAPWSVSSFEVAEILTADYGEEFSVPVVYLVDNDDVTYSPEITVKNNNETVELSGMKFRIDSLRDYVITYTVIGKDEKVYEKHTVVKVYPPYEVSFPVINVAECEGNDELLNSDESIVSGYEGTLTDFDCIIVGIVNEKKESVEKIDWTKAGLYEVTYKISASELREKEIVRNVRIYGNQYNITNFEKGEMPSGYTVVSAGHEEVATKAVLSLEKGGYLSDYALKYTSGNAGYSSVLKITDKKFISDLRTFDLLTFRVYASLELPEMSVKAVNGSTKELARIEKANEWQTVTLRTNDILDVICAINDCAPESLEAVHFYFACLDTSSVNYYMLIDDITFDFDVVELDPLQKKDVSFYGAEGVSVKAFDEETEMTGAIDENKEFACGVPGSYRIVYSFKDVYGRDVSFERTIVVRKPYYGKKTAPLGVKKGGVADLTLTDEDYTGFEAIIKFIVNKDGDVVERIDTDKVGEYEVTYLITANEISDTEITRSVTVYEKVFGIMSFDDGTLPEEFVIVKHANYDEVNTLAKLTIEKDEEFGYDLRFTSGNQGNSAALRIRNAEFLEYVALFDTLTIRFVTNNPYAGQINVNWWDCLKPALFAYARFIITARFSEDTFLKTGKIFLTR